MIWVKIGIIQNTIFSTKYNIIPNNIKKVLHKCMCAIIVYNIHGICKSIQNILE